MEQRRSEWLTGIRIRRLAEILVRTPSIPAGIGRRETYRHLWKRCGGPLGETPILVSVLSGLKLLREDRESFKRTPAGDKLAKTLRQRDDSALTLTLIRSGHFFDQARLLLETGKIDGGVLRCPIRTARVVAPQLVAIVEGWTGVSTYPDLVIPNAILQELNSVWALLPPEPEIPKWAAERKAVGNRAEMYTVQLERTRVSPSKILWVARDSDSLGFDVEDTSVSPTRCIEVKGRRDNDVVFYLSEREWEKAQELGDRYEVHFWGEIDLATEPAVEYALLRNNGYPVVFKNPATLIGMTLVSVPVKWRVTFSGQRD
jgi:hypothetical protein